MASVTYWVVQPFERSRKGEVIVLRPVEAQNASHAQRIAQRYAAKGGAIAFSRSGDPDIGEFAEAEIICTVGDVPEDAPDLASAAA